ncbi:C40 family peptidase [Anditalea andensis]|uniref:C40 family peptidase n=1 Tax=Anditalea andensis TaxID=1048983 RepID=UPI001F0A1CF7|nr:SH3 domain-containing protein [Anditalea andensis]
MSYCFYQFKSKISIYTCLAAILSCYLFLACERLDSPESGSLIEETRTEFAPDKRVALFDISFENNILSGETNLPEALETLKNRFEENGIAYTDQVTVLPMLEGKHFGVVTISVANIRSQPKHSAELATQATMGTPLNVLKQDGTWYLVQTPDQYISWIDAAGIQLMDQEEFQQWDLSEKAVFTSLIGYVYADENQIEMVSDLTAGNVLEVIGRKTDFYEVKLPDGRKGYVNSSSMEPLGDWIASRNPSHENLISTAKSMMGIPYLWGGTSIKGVDCSGFTKTVFFLNGQIIPRDASQQIHEGEEVDKDKNWENLQVGDLLFFGKPAAADSPEKVIHVGMWIGNNSFIHSRGRVRISSFDPDSEHFDEYELDRYLRTKRILGKESQNILAVEKFIR